MLNNVPLDAVFLIVPRTHSWQIYLDLIKFNKFIFFEKPIANTFDQIKNYKINLNKKIFNKTVVGYMKRFDESYIYLKNNLKKLIEMYGPIRHASLINITGNSYYGEKNYIQRDNLNYYLKKLKTNSFNKKKAVFLNTFGHNIDTLINLFGDNELLEFCTQRNSCSSMLKNTKKNFLISFFCQLNEKKDWTEELIIYFDHAKIKLSFPPALLKNQSGKINITDYRKNLSKKLIFNSKWSFNNQIDAFYKFINGNKKTNLCSIEEALKNIEISDKIFK